MKGYIPKQPKQIKERLEAKLDARLIRKLERYCEYLDSDRDYIISQAVEIAFKKDQGFTEWLSRQPAAPAPSVPATLPDNRRAPKIRPRQDSVGTNGASTAGAPALLSPSILKGA